ncbi:hypothetical protein FRC10_012141, partial [Ceratobasidium sp. 414]
MYKDLLGKLSSLHSASLVLNIIQVVSGDTCTSIPQKNSTSSYQLTKLNPSLNCNALSTSQS